MNESPTTLSFDQVAQRLDKAGVVWAVFAGAAASVYGASRPVTDIDILVPSTEGVRVAGIFPEAQVKFRADGTIKSVKLPNFDILAGLDTLDLDARMATRLRSYEIEGVVAPVIPPEDNILLKAMWGRGPAEGKQDWEDVRAMIAYLPTLDWAYLRWRAETCGADPGVLPKLERLAQEGN